MVLEARLLESVRESSEASKISSPPVGFRWGQSWMSIVGDKTSLTDVSTDQAMRGINSDQMHAYSFISFLINLSICLPCSKILTYQVNNSWIDGRLVAAQVAKQSI